MTLTRLQPQTIQCPLKVINRLPRAIGLIVGPSGTGETRTGKTRTGVVIGVCYLRMGGHVLLSSPTTGAYSSSDLLLS